MITIKKILRAINDPNLDLWRHESGYFIFVWDDKRPDAANYETESVYCDRLNHMSFEQWVQIGKEFSEKMRNRA